MYPQFQINASNQSQSKTVKATKVAKMKDSEASSCFESMGTKIK